MASEDGYVVRLRGLVVDFRIGVHPHEQGGAQRVRVDVVVVVARPKDGFCEDYRRVYCYERLAKGVRALAAAGHVRLVETLAARIAEFAQARPRARRGEGQEAAARRVGTDGFSNCSNTWSADH